MNRPQRVNQSQKVFSIDSSQRSNGSVSNFDIAINMPHSNAFNKAAVIVCELPKSFYHLDSTNNTFDFDLSTVTIPANQFYTATTFAAAVQTAVAAVIASTTCTYSSTTGKLTIYNATTDFSILATGVIAKYLGVVSGTRVYSDNFTGTEERLICPNIVNMQRYDVIYIRASGLQNNNDNVLLEIYPGLSTDLSVIQYSNISSDIHNVTVEQNNMNVMHFSVQDKDGKDIEFNGVNWRMLLYMGFEA
jgi:hypothetical protein